MRWYALLLRLAGLPDPADPRTTLEAMEEAIARRLGVEEMTAATLAAQRDAHLIFDVRRPEEYAQSHIPAAIRIEPGTSARAFLAAHGTRITGARVVFCCAIGWRSGWMIRRLRGRLGAAQPAALLNLRGGMFRWAREGLPLAGASTVHPFDARWAPLLHRAVSGGTGA